MPKRKKPIKLYYFELVDNDFTSYRAIAGEKINAYERVYTDKDGKVRRAKT